MTEPTEPVNPNAFHEMYRDKTHLIGQPGPMFLVALGIKHDDPRLANIDFNKASELEIRKALNMATEELIPDNMVVGDDGVLYTKEEMTFMTGMASFTADNPVESRTTIKSQCDTCGNHFPLPVVITVLDIKPDEDDKLSDESIPVVVCGDCEKRIQ